MKKNFFNKAWFTGLVLVSAMLLTGCGKKNNAPVPPPPAYNPGNTTGNYGGGGGYTGGNCITGTPLNGQGSQVSMTAVPRPIGGSNGMNLIISDLSHSGNYLNQNLSIGAQAYFTWGDLPWILGGSQQNGNQPINMCSPNGGTSYYGQINVELQGYTYATPPGAPPYLYLPPQQTPVLMTVTGTIQQNNRLNGMVYLSINGQAFTYQAN